jgi:hypothetical protein
MSFLQSIIPQRLNAAQELLKGSLLPEFKRLKEKGYSTKEIGKAIVSHYEQTKEPIETEAVRRLLQEPNQLLLAYRNVAGKPNKPSSAQTGILTELFKDSGERTKAVEVLAKVLLFEAIPPGSFRSIATQLRASKLHPNEQILKQWLSLVN